MHSRAPWILAGLALLALAPTCVLPGQPRFEAPAPGLLAAPGEVTVRLVLPAGAGVESLELRVDGAPVDTAGFQVTDTQVEGVLTLDSAGRHRLEAWVDSLGLQRRASTWVELVALDRPDSCEILNQVECVLPFPSSRFLEPAADTATGFRVAYADDTLPTLLRLGDNGGFGPLDPAPYRKNDGFSPTVQVLMHFPDGLDPVASDAPRLDPETRTYDERGLEPTSPTVLVDLDTGERVNHWIENDDRATNPDRVATFLRPAVSLEPGHRYAVAVRTLVAPDGEPVAAEPVFAAIRDGRASELPAVEARRAELEPLLERLAELGEARDGLVLAFEFVVQSDASLTHEMLAMRDQSFAWLEARLAEGTPTFTIDSVTELNAGCTDPDQPVWREVRGSFEAPLFLDRDPFVENTEVGFLQRDAQGEPTFSTTTNAPFTVAVPCAVFGVAGDTQPLPGLMVGHGLFGDGEGTVSGLTQAPQLADFRFIAAGTNWSGLSNPDIEPSILESFIFKVTGNLDNIDALADRLRQGQAQTLLLTRMLALGVFNENPAFQGSDGVGVIDSSVPPVYFGASLGGIMGTMYAALTPDVQRFNVDVPAINFALLLQRATPFIVFQDLLNLVNPDIIVQAIGLSLIHEIWVRGEPAGYATHVKGELLPGVQTPREILMTVALFDQQVTNLGAQLSGSTLGLQVLEGSVMRNLAGMEDATGPLSSGYIVYDTGSFDPSIPEHLPFIPPLVNRQAEPNRCDPHGRRGFIPASVEQLLGFLTEGVIQNFCVDDGVCNASDPGEIPFGDPEPCDPLS